MIWYYIVFSENININKRIVNGATTIIISFSCDEIGVVTMIMIQP